MRNIDQSFELKLTSKVNNHSLEIVCIQLFANARCHCGRLQINIFARILTKPNATETINNNDLSYYYLLQTFVAKKNKIYCRYIQIIELIHRNQESSQERPLRE